MDVGNLCDTVHIIQAPGRAPRWQYRYEEYTVDYREHGRSRSARAAAVLFVVMALALMASAGSASAAGSGTFFDSFHFGVAKGLSVKPRVLGPATGAVHYAVNKQVCPRPKSPNVDQCFAVIRVPVAKGTRNAIAYRLPRAIAANTGQAKGGGPTGGYTPKQLSEAYGYNPNIKRSSQLIALVDWYNDPNARKDLNTFDKKYGLHQETSTSFRQLNQAGKASPLPKNDKESSVEESLDIESARAVCHTCRIVLIEAKGPNNADTSAAENEAAKLKATEISNSFGSLESSQDKTVTAYNHPGIVITASTGDYGWYGWTTANTNAGESQNAAEFPAESPDVVAVGGTSLYINGNGTRTSETVWNDNGFEDNGKYAPGGAGGGGCSTVFTAPSWQSSYPGYTAAGCDGMRLDADVAAIADPETGFDIIDTYFTSKNKGWLTVGGTSLASPVIAAMWALAGGAHGVKHPASTLYANGAGHPSGFYDVKSGGNGFCGGDTTTDCAEAVYNGSQEETNNPNGLGAGLIDCSFPFNGNPVSSAPALSSECNATTGFDGPSGIGTPKGLSMFSVSSSAVTASGKG
jgi:hypothetical protein